MYVHIFQREKKQELLSANSAWNAVQMLNFICAKRCPKVASILDALQALWLADSDMLQLVPQYKYPMVDANLMDGPKGIPIVEVPLDGERLVMQICSTKSLNKSVISLHWLSQKQALRFSNRRLVCWFPHTLPFTLSFFMKGQSTTYKPEKY